MLFIFTHYSILLYLYNLPIILTNFTHYSHLDNLQGNAFVGVKINFCNKETLCAAIDNS